MTGYVHIYPSELKVKELSKYRAYYCGLCRFLRKNFRQSAGLTLSYDFTFLVMLHTSLYGSKNTKNKHRCPVHPLSGTVSLTNDYTKYAADMNLFMVYKKIQDDCMDEKRPIAFISERLFRNRIHGIRLAYPEKTDRIACLQSKLRDMERRNHKDLEDLSSVFGNMLSEIFVVRKDLWEPVLSRFGFFLGKFIYILDAYDDLEKDKKSGSFNPLTDERGRLIYTEEEIKEWLTANIASACMEFEKLPCVKDYSILRNILYQGVWTNYNLIKHRRMGSKHEQKSL